MEILLFSLELVRLFETSTRKLSLIARMRVRIPASSQTDTPESLEPQADGLTQLFLTYFCEFEI